MLELIKNKKVNIYTNLNGNNPLIPIATDELFLRQPLTSNECILHIHSLENSAILGTPDTRVPYFKEALDSFYNNNLIPAVRNIGGLGIIADTGVISFSIIMKINPSTFSLNVGYNLMTEFIKAIFPEASSKIQAVEISNSYCPGDFDLSIDGKKFAGIAQRKVKENVVVSIYLSLFGNQQNRTRIMKEYYEAGLKDQEIKYKYPKIDISCMDTLENLLNKSLTIKELLEKILRVLHSLENSAILGTPDTRVPFFKEALDSFYNNNLIPAVRNIGGLGIIADTGVVSFSIIMNINPSTFSLNAGYNLMTEFIKAIFPEASSKIQAVEISNSYCPGDFDLSIDGKKFAGIAQRKVKENVVVSIYLSLFGNQQNRTKIMKEYYETGLKDQEIKYKYPKIDINCMDTLENLLNKSLTTKELLERMLRVLHSLNCEIEKGNYSNKMIEDYEEIFKQTKQRNNKLLHGE